MVLNNFYLQDTYSYQKAQVKLSPSFCLTVQFPGCCEFLLIRCVSEQKLQQTQRLYSYINIFVRKTYQKPTKLILKKCFIYLENKLPLDLERLN